MAIYKANPVRDENGRLVFDKEELVTPERMTRRLDGRDALNPYPDDTISADFDVGSRTHANA
jgi:hypothetical protein